MNLTLILWGALALLFMAMLPALTTPQHFRYHLTRMVLGLRHFDFRDLIWSQLGATVTYFSPFTNTGTTTAPTAAQASVLPAQTAQIFWADSDVAVATVTHNWGNQLGLSFASYLWPEVWMIKVLGGASDSSFATNFTFGLASSFAVFINKISAGVGSGGTYNVYMRLPHSVGR